jgi:hypothetical protein
LGETFIPKVVFDQKLLVPGVDDSYWWMVCSFYAFLRLFSSLKPIVSVQALGGLVSSGGSLSDFDFLFFYLFYFLLL